MGLTEIQFIAVLHDVLTGQGCATCVHQRRHTVMLPACGIEVPVAKCNLFPTNESAQRFDTFHPDFPDRVPVNGKRCRVTITQNGKRVRGYKKCE